MPGTVPVNFESVKENRSQIRGMKKAVEEVGDMSEFSAGRPVSLWIQRKEALWGRRVKAEAKE